MNTLVQNNYRLRISAAVAASQQAAGVQHPGLQGQLREIVARELLRPLLPPTLSFGRGKIIDHVGNQSAEIDIVIYDRSVMPPVVFATDETLGLYPVDACLYAFEVKTRARAASVRDAVATATSVANLQYVPERCHPVLGHPVNRVHFGLFAFGSTVRTGKAEIDRLMHEAGAQTHVSAGTVGNQPANVAAPTLNVACIIGRGYGYFVPFHHQQGGQWVSSWGWRDATPDHDEVLWFMAGVVNTLHQVAGTLRGIPFGRYLV